MSADTAKAISSVREIGLEEPGGDERLRTWARYFAQDATFGDGQESQAVNALRDKAAELGIPEDPVVTEAIQTIRGIQPMW